ncbi:uncharacterized protein LOC124698769 [Lolium rigidum]|uniref:uncharacterized protein LOC124698769 n=1 Tax=Lolium rigidum TaxID=89674 RepID=UPI001F5C3BC9|nr:uncharacterized protein LOC124698769 [Lolium rigidum]
MNSSPLLSAADQARLSTSTAPGGRPAPHGPQLRSGGDRRPPAHVPMTSICSRFRNIFNLFRRLTGGSKDAAKDQRCSAMVDIGAPVHTKGLRHPMAVVPWLLSVTLAAPSYRTSAHWTSLSGTVSLPTSWLPQCTGENSSDGEKISYGMSWADVVFPSVDKLWSKHCLKKTVIGGPKIPLFKS